MFGQLLSLSVSGWHITVRNNDDYRCLCSAAEKVLYIRKPDVCLKVHIH